MSSQENSDKLFWLAYCDLIKQQIGTGFNPETSALFFATKGTRGPPAGEGIDVAYTNAGIYDMANNLLDPGNLFYSPTAMSHYTDSLLTYLEWVDLGGTPDNAHLRAVMDTEEDMKAAEKKKSRELNDASKQFKNEAELGVTNGLTFNQWLQTYALSYIAADQAYSAAAAANMQAVKAAYGQMGSQWTRDRTQIIQATSSSILFQGINMPCTGLSAPSAREILNANRSGGKVPAPDAVFYNALFYSSDYPSVVKDWQTVVNTDMPQSRGSLSINSGKDIQEGSFGQTTMSAGVSFSYAPWVSFSAGASSDHREEEFKTDSEAQNITIEVFWRDIKPVRISAGKWDIGNPSARYPKLKQGAPAVAKTLVRPTQLILASGLGYRVKFGSELASTFDKKVTDTKQAGGYVKIFGIPISLGGDYKQSTENTTHAASWDSTKGELEVKATVDGGFATVIAVMGEKIKTQ